MSLFILSQLILSYFIWPLLLTHSKPLTFHSFEFTSSESSKLALLDRLHNQRDNPTRIKMKLFD